VSEHDEVETLERRYVVAPEVGWALREVMRLGPEVDAACARRMGLHHTDAVALDHLLQTEQGMGPAELGRRLGIRPASVTELVDRLEQAGHVRRRPHPSDRRRLLVEPTAQARRDVLAALEPLFAGMDELAAGLDEDTAAALTAYLRAVARELRRYCDANPR